MERLFDFKHNVHIRRGLAQPLDLRESLLIRDGLRPRGSLFRPDMEPKIKIAGKLKLIPPCPN